MLKINNSGTAGRLEQESNDHGKLQGTLRHLKVQRNTSFCISCLDLDFRPKL